MLIYKCLHINAHISVHLQGTPGSQLDPPLTLLPQFLGVSWEICVFTLFPHESWTALSSLGHPLSREPQQQRNNVFLFRHNVPFPVSFYSLLSPVFSVKWFCCAPSLRYGEGAERWFFVWEMRSFLEPQTLFRQWPPKPSSLSEPCCLVNMQTLCQTVFSWIFKYSIILLMYSFPYTLWRLGSFSVTTNYWKMWLFDICNCISFYNSASVIFFICLLF